MRAVAAPEIGGKAMILSGLNVLLAEDNPTNQLVASQMLECLGATVNLAVDGAQALDMVRHRAFDVLLVDIEMPRVNGIEVIKTLRADPGPLSGLPIIALTAYVMREHRLAIDAAGADGVIAKPILSIEQFGAEIRRFMRKRVPDLDPVADRSDSVIDRDVFDALAEAIGPSAMGELLEKVTCDLRTSRDRLAKSIERDDAPELRAVSHILISVAGAIGGIRAQELARIVNTSVHSGDIAGMRRSALDLHAEVDSLLNELGRSRPAAHSR